MNYCHVKGHRQGYQVTMKRNDLLYSEAFYKKCFAAIGTEPRAWQGWAGILPLSYTPGWLSRFSARVYFFKDTRMKLQNTHTEDLRCNLLTETFEKM